MAYQKGTIETINLILRLYSHLDKNNQLVRLGNFILQIETKANHLLNNNRGNTKREGVEVQKEIYHSNYWKGVAETTRKAKKLVFEEPNNLYHSLLEMKQEVSELVQGSGFQNPDGNDMIPLTQQIIKGGKISVLGLDRAGKTSILQRLKTGRWIPNTTPTIGMNSETIIIGKVRFVAWDLGGQMQFRRTLWPMYTKNSVGIIFVVDLNDPRRNPEVRSNLKKVLSLTHLENLPLAVFANKTDLADEIEERDLLNKLGLSKSKSREIKVFKTSAKTGEGILEGFYWLSDLILLRMEEEENLISGKRSKISSTHL